MKFTLALLVTLAIFISGGVSDDESEDDVHDEYDLYNKLLQKNFGVTFGEWLEKCGEHGNCLQKKILELIKLSHDIARDTTNEIVRMAKMQQNADNEYYDKITDTICESNIVLKHIRAYGVNKLQTCFDKKDQLNETGKQKYIEELKSGFCNLIKEGAKKKAKKM